MMSQAWSGRFQKGVSENMALFSESISFDRHLLEWDVKVTACHVENLQKSGQLDATECDTIVKALSSVREAIADNLELLSMAHEDIHMNVEALLREKIGDLADKIHAGRSRNDQVVTDLRLWVRSVCEEIIAVLSRIQLAVLEKAKEYDSIVTVAYTHMQQGQPLMLAHHLYAYIEMLERDKKRFRHAAEAAKVCPYGSGACVGTSFLLDREKLATTLGFSELSRNSVDATSDRDFLCDYVYAVSLCGVHLSRMAEEWVLWSTTEFSFLSVGESYCTGSSMMPNKKNVDAAELIRGQSASLVSELQALLILTKGTGLGYHRDFQDDKRRLFDFSHRFLLSLEICQGMVPTFEFLQRSAYSLLKGHCYATDIAEYLVHKGLPFRKAHHVAGALVGLLEQENQLVYEWLNGKSVDDLNNILLDGEAFFAEDFFELCPPLEEKSEDGYLNCLVRLVRSKRGSGGTSQESIKAQDAYWRGVLK